MLLGLLIALFRKLLPLRYSTEQMGVPLTKLREYQKYGWMNLGFFLLLAPLFIYGTFESLRASASGYVPAIAQPVVAIRAGDGFWLATSFVPGLVLACCVIVLLERLLLGAGRSSEYRMLTNRKRGFNVTKGLVVLAVLITAGFATMGYFGRRAGLYLGQDEMVIHRMWSLQEERYRYDQVKALREVRDEDQGRWHFVIQVKGAPDWNTDQEVTFPDDEHKALLAQRTGKAILRGQGR